MMWAQGFKIHLHGISLAQASAALHFLVQSFPATEKGIFETSLI